MKREVPVIRPINTLRRLTSNSDRSAQLLSQVSESLIHLVNQADSTNNRLDRLWETLNNQAAASNERSDRLSESVNNQAATSNERMDRIAYSLQNHAAASSARMVKLVEAYENQSQAANRRLDALIEAWNNQSRDANLRLDALIASPDRQTRGSRPALDKPARTGISGAPRTASILTPGRQPQTNGGYQPLPTNDLAFHQRMLDQLTPWSGDVPPGFLVDYLGTLTDASFRIQYGVDPSSVGGTFVKTEFPKLDGSNGEWWFETVNWLAAAQDARDHFVMITLGACYGAQAVGAYRVLQLVNPIPCKLVAVEPEPENFNWLRQHMQDNGIDPEEHWLVPMAI